MQEEEFALKLFLFNVKEHEEEFKKQESSLYHQLSRQYLTQQEQLKIGKFYQPLDRYRSLIGKVLCRYYLKREIFNDENDDNSLGSSLLNNIGQCEYGKPYLKKKNKIKGNESNALSSIDFNISHSGQWVLFGYYQCGGGGGGKDHNNEKVLGLDIEEVHVRETKIDDKWNLALTEFYELMRTCFTDREWTAILYPLISSLSPHILGILPPHINEDGEIPPVVKFRSDQFELLLKQLDVCTDENVKKETMERFFIHWTLKESFIKALGMGVSFGELTRIEFRFNSPSSILDECIECERVDEIVLSPTTIDNSKKDKIKVFIDGEDNSTEWDFVVIRNFTKDHMMSIALGSLNSKHIPLELKLNISKNCSSGTIPHGKEFKVKDCKKLEEFL